MAVSRHLSPRHVSSDAPVTEKPKQTATCHLSPVSPRNYTHTRAHTLSYFSGDNGDTVTSGGKPRLLRHCGVTGPAGVVTGEGFPGFAPNLSRIVRLPRRLSVERAAQLLGVSVVRLVQVFGCERPADLISARDLRVWIQAFPHDLAYWQAAYRTNAHGSPHRLRPAPA